MLNSSAIALYADQYVPLFGDLYPYFTNVSATSVTDTFPTILSIIIAALATPQPLEPIV